MHHLRTSPEYVNGAVDGHFAPPRQIRSNIVATIQLLFVVDTVIRVSIQKDALRSLFREPNHVIATVFKSVALNRFLFSFLNDTKFNRNVPSSQFQVLSSMPTDPNRLKNNNKK